MLCLKSAIVFLNAVPGLCQSLCPSHSDDVPCIPSAKIQLSILQSPWKLGIQHSPIPSLSLLSILDIPVGGCTSPSLLKLAHS